MHKTPMEWKPVVIDFGKSRPRSNPKRYELSDVQKDFYKRNHPWIAPELIGGTHDQSPASDVRLVRGHFTKYVKQVCPTKSLFRES